MSASTYSITDNQQGDVIDVGTPDWNAKEQGAFPPDLTPGTYEFTFVLQNNEAPEGAPFEIKEMGKPTKVPTLQVNFKGTYTKTLPDGTTVDRTLGFQRANFYQSEKMKAANMNSSGVELLRALGLSNLTPYTAENIKAALQQADGRVKFTATTGWEHYDKAADKRTSTNPNKKNGDVKWPRAADGSYEPFITPPSKGTKVTGKTIIVGYKLPKA